MRIFKQFYFILLIAPWIISGCSEDEQNSEEVIPDEEPVVVENVGVGLVTHFKLNGNADDATAGSFNATIVGNPNTEDGVEGSALFFNEEDRKSTRLNSSHVKISYAVFCLKKKRIGYCRALK